MPDPVPQIQNVPEGDGIAVFRHTITGDSEEMLCTLGIGINDTIFDPPVGGNFQAFVNSLATKWQQALDTSLPSTVTMVGCTLYVMSPGGFAVYSSTVAPVAGVSSGSSLPPNCAVLIHKHSGLGGRRGRGRMFLPGVTESGVDPNGNIVSANLTQLTTDVNTLFTSLSDDNGVDDLLLYHSNPAGDIPPTAITGFSVDPKISTQRRRLR